MNFSWDIVNDMSIILNNILYSIKSRVSGGHLYDRRQKLSIFPGWISSKLDMVEVKGSKNNTHFIEIGGFEFF